MAETLDMGKEMNLGIGERMKEEGVEEMEAIGVIEKIEKAGEVAVRTAEIVEIMEAQEPITTTMEEGDTADQGEGPEESARRLQASGSLL